MEPTWMPGLLARNLVGIGVQPLLGCLVFDTGCEAELHQRLANFRLYDVPERPDDARNPMSDGGFT